MKEHVVTIVLVTADYIESQTVRNFLRNCALVIGVDTLIEVTGVRLDTHTSPERLARIKRQSDAQAGTTKEKTK